MCPTRKVSYAVFPHCSAHDDAKILERAAIATEKKEAKQVKKRAADAVKKQQSPKVCKPDPKGKKKRGKRQYNKDSHIRTYFTLEKQRHRCRFCKQLLTCFQSIQRELSSMHNHLNKIHPIHYKIIQDNRNKGCLKELTFENLEVLASEAAAEEDSETDHSIGGKNQEEATLDENKDQNTTGNSREETDSKRQSPENSLAPRSSAMPASVNETVSAFLLLSPSTICEREAKISHEDTLLRNNNCSNSPNAQGKGIDDANDPHLPVPTNVLFAMEKVQMQWPMQRNNAGSGFINAGNSCYLNSVLQALFHIPPMVNWLIDGDQQHQRSCNTFINNTTECIICCMAVTLKQSQQEPEEMRPHLILARLCSICHRFTPGQQEDAMEFLRYLFEAMAKCYLCRFNGLELESSSKETTPLNQIFGGYIRTVVTCLHCRGKCTTFQHFLDLTLDISRGPSLEHALDMYFGQERLGGDNSYNCDKCRRKVPAAKQFFIERLPNVLCIQLKRFNTEQAKISNNVQLAERINLQRFLSRPKPLPGQHVQKPPRGACYRLQAGVNHLGHTAQSGHYTTVAYASNSTLYHFDDKRVRPLLAGQGFSGTDVYLLMYVLDSKQENSRPVSSPSATATSQSLQANRSPAKLTVSPSFIPLQCRPKPAIILNQNPNKIIFNNSEFYESQGTTLL